MKKLSEDDFIDTLKTKTRNAYKIAIHSPIFFEDDEFEGDFGIINPDKKDTKSGFWIDKLTAQFSSWSRFPKRLRCLRGYTDIEKVGGESSDKALIMIPFDGSKIGVAKDESFYRSFKHAKSTFGSQRLDNTTLKEWFDTLVEAIKAALDGSKIKFPNTPTEWSEFSSAIESLEAIIGKHKPELQAAVRKEDKLEKKLRLELKMVLERHITDLNRYLEEKLDPEQNSFALTRIESFNAVGPHEVWTDSPCLIVRRKTYVELYNKGSLT
jgi:hypothetical protein